MRSRTPLLPHVIYRAEATTRMHRDGFWHKNTGCYGEQLPVREYCVLEEWSSTRIYFYHFWLEAEISSVVCASRQWKKESIIYNCASSRPVWISKFYSWLSFTWITRDRRIYFDIDKSYSLNQWNELKIDLCNFSWYVARLPEGESGVRGSEGLLIFDSSLRLCLMVFRVSLVRKLTFYSRCAWQTGFRHLQNLGLEFQ